MENFADDYDYMGSFSWYRITAASARAAASFGEILRAQIAYPNSTKWPSAEVWPQADRVI